MFYEVRPELIELGAEIPEFKSDRVYVGIITLAELKQEYEKFGFSPATIESCEKISHTIQNSISVYDTYSFGLLHIINSKDIYKRPDRIAFYITDRMFLVVDIFDEDRSTISALELVISHAKQGKETLEKIIYGFICRLILDENIEIEHLETAISQMEKRVFVDEYTNAA